MTSKGWHEERLSAFTLVCWAGARLVVTLFPNSEVVVVTVTELWAAENVVGDESATDVDTNGEVVV